MRIDRAGIRSACIALAAVAVSVRAVAQPVPTVVPPEPLAPIEAPVPAAVSEQVATPGVVVVLVTVEVDGTVGDAEVVAGAGELLDGLALEAARAARFRPATRNGVAIRARVRIPFRFDPPSVTPAPDEPTAEGPSPASDAEAASSRARPADDVAPSSAAPSPATSEVLEVTVRGERRPRHDPRGASDVRIDRAVLEAAPRDEGADVLRTVPGLTIARPEGLAVGHRYTLRGFDSDHGQDLAFRVAGLPINLPSHVHGQGYADLGFLIADVVDAVDATEGVHDPRQGDFAVAGSLDLHLGVERTGVRLATSYGAFGTVRQLATFAPATGEGETFAAVRIARTRGFGPRRGGRSASAIVQAGFDAGDWHLRAVGIAHFARADLPGVVRADDVADGTIDLYGVYPYATARAQNAFAARAIAGLFAEHRGDGGERTEIGLHVGVDDFRIQQNFTGFVERSRTLENVSGRGDLMEQTNRTRTIGIVARHRTARLRPFRWLRGHADLGVEGRIDTIDQTQALLDASVRGQTWDERVDATIVGGDLGAYGELDLSLARVVRLRLGARADALAYDITDRLGNFVPRTRPDDAYIVGFRRSAFGVAWGPRASVAIAATDWMSVQLAYGEGYRSPQARMLDDGETTPFAKVRSSDVGIRLAWDERYEATVSGYLTHLSDDVAFDAAEGRLERIGATRRLGASAHVRAQPVPWLLAAASITYVDAELLEPPPSTAEEPSPPFRRGQNLPFVPPVVARVDLDAHPVLRRDVRGHDLVGRASVGFSYLSRRPLPYGDRADPVAVVDASIGARWGAIDLGLELFNLTNARYASTELAFASSWDPDASRGRTPARHLVAGAPFAWLLTLGIAP